MTMAEDMIRPDAAAAHDGRLALAVRLPWYRSLPLSCLESVRITAAGVTAPIRSVAVPGFAGSIEDAAGSDVVWDLRDALNLTLDVSARPGEAVALDVAVAIRIPYIQQAPGVPLVHRTTVRTEATIR